MCASSYRLFQSPIPNIYVVTKHQVRNRCLEELITLSKELLEITSSHQAMLNMLSQEVSADDVFEPEELPQLNPDNEPWTSLHSPPHMIRRHVIIIPPTVRPNNDQVRNLALSRMIINQCAFAILLHVFSRHWPSSTALVLLLALCCRLFFSNLRNFRALAATTAT